MACRNPGTPLPEGQQCVSQLLFISVSESEKLRRIQRLVDVRDQLGSRQPGCCFTGAACWFTGAVLRFTGGLAGREPRRSRSVTQLGPLPALVLRMQPDCSSILRCI